MDKNIVIGNQTIGVGHPCFIIAEAGVNHNGSLELAKKLVDAAVEAGADAVKFQTFKAKNVVTNIAPMAIYQENNIGQVKSQQEMLKKLELDYNAFIIIKNYCDYKKIIFLSTPHSEDAIDFLDLIVPAYKIGSGDLTNIPLLKRIARKNKPMIIGTGMSNLWEIKEALQVIAEEGNHQVAMLHCTTNYPTPVNEVNLRSMQTMQKELDCLVGYSDHTVGNDVSLAAVGLGAIIIEKHFTLDRNLPGPDHKASLEPFELKALVQAVRNNKLVVPTETILGSHVKKQNFSELQIMDIVRKSIILRNDIPAGKNLTEEDIIIKRPGTGIHPRYYNDILGRKLKSDLKADHILSWRDVY